MDWSSIGKQVATFAPAIGSAIGGPVGAVAGMGVRALCSFFGIEADAPDAEAQATAALQAMTPEQAIQLKKQDQDFQTEMKKLGVDVFKLETQDRDSARKMQIATKSWVPGAMAILITLGFFGLLGLMCWQDLPVANAKALDIMLGSLGTAWIAVVMFYFGSSIGSQAKTELLGGKK